jgi:hypothetical protein
MDGVQGKGLSVAEPWSEALAREALMEALSCLDAADLARHVAPADGCSVAFHPRVKVAVLEVRKRIDDLMEGVRELLWAVLHGVDANAQQEALDVAMEITREAWLRLDILDPRFALARDELRTDHPEVIRHGASFSTDVAAVIEKIGFEVTSTPPSPSPRRWHFDVTTRFPGTGREIIEHFARLGGAPLPASPSETVRYASGIVTASEIHNPRDNPPRTIPELWRYLVMAIDDMRANAPLAPLRPLAAFYETSYFTRFGPKVMRACEETQYGGKKIPLFTGFLHTYLDLVKNYDAARADSEMLIKKALLVLGHKTETFSGAARIKGVRAQDKRHPNRPRAKGGRPRKGP